MLIEPLADVVTLADVSDSTTDAFWVLAEQDVDARATGLASLQECADRAWCGDDMPGPVHYLRRQQTTVSAVGEEQTN